MPVKSQLFHLTLWTLKSQLFHLTLQLFHLTLWTLKSQLFHLTLWTFKSTFPSDSMDIPITTFPSDSTTFPSDSMDTQITTFPSDSMDIPITTFPSDSTTFPSDSMDSQITTFPSDSMDIPITTFPSDSMDSQITTIYGQVKSQLFHLTLCILWPPPLPRTAVSETRHDLRGLLLDLQSAVYLVEPGPTANCVNVVRSRVLECALRTFSRRAFNPQQQLDIVFVDSCGTGEGSVDTGGPTR